MNLSCKSFRFVDTSLQLIPNGDNEAVWSTSPAISERNNASEVDCDFFEHKHLRSLLQVSVKSKSMSIKIKSFSTLLECN